LPCARVGESVHGWVMKLFPEKRAKSGPGQKQAAVSMRAAVAEARQRLGGEGQLIGLAAGLVLVSFVMLALAAPLALVSPGFVSWIAGGLVLCVLMAAVGLGGVAVARMARVSGGGAGTGPDLNSAIATVLGEAEDAGLKAIGSRHADEAFSGKVAGRPCAAVRQGGKTWAVTRGAKAFEVSVILTPLGAVWPHPLPDMGELGPCQPPSGIPALAWASDRLLGQALLSELAPALALAEAGGELPLMCVRGRSVVLAFSQADAAAGLVIASEVARASVVAQGTQAG
jgi:hypothetical protein